MANYFEECQKCVPPTRHPGCHATCPHYAEAKAKYDADKERANKTTTLKYYANEQNAKVKDNVAKYASRRPKRYRHK